MHHHIFQSESRSDKRKKKRDILDQIPIQIARFGDYQIAYREIGTGDPLVLIMGMGGTISEWDRVFLDMLASQYRLILLDNRGIGDSTGRDTDCSIPNMASDTCRLIRSIGISPAHILGYSIGSMIALEMFRQDPEIISSLILYAVATNGKETIDRLSPFIDPSSVEIVTIDALFPDNWLASHQDLENVFPIRSHPIDGPAILRQIEDTRRWIIDDETLSSIDLPVLILVGSEDIITPPDRAAQIALTIPGSSIEIFPDGGHAVLYQQPEKIACSILHFLKNRAGFESYK